MLFEYHSLDEAMECYGLNDDNEDAGYEDLVDKILKSIEETKKQQYYLFKTILEFHGMSIEDLFNLMLYSDYKIKPKTMGAYCGAIKEFIANEDTLSDLSHDLDITDKWR